MDHKIAVVKFRKANNESRQLTYITYSHDRFFNNKTIKEKILI